MKIQEIQIPVQIRAQRKNKTTLSTLGKIIGFAFSLLFLYIIIILLCAVGGPL